MKTILLPFLLSACAGPEARPSAARPSHVQEPSLGWRSEIEARIAAEQRRFVRDGDAWRAASRSGAVRALLGGGEVQVEPRERGATWNVTLHASALGRPGRMHRLPGVEPTLGACDPEGGTGTSPDCIRRLELRHPDVVEWWRNGARGLEQGFDVLGRPPGSGPLVVRLRVRGPVQTAIDADRKGASFTHGGREVLRYAGLVATDATGRALAARLAKDPGGLSIRVEDDGSYPIRIDPIVGVPTLTLEPEQAGTSFGGVASAGDVNGDGYDDVVAGVPGWDGGSPEEGRAFLFFGGPDGIDPVAAEWTAESNQAFSHFGSAVASAGDVNGDGLDDVVVGAPNYENGQSWEGRAYLYLGDETTGLENAASWTAEIDANWAYFGSSLSAGDVNGDGFDDVVVGAPFSAIGEGGRAYVFHGSAAGLGAAAAWTHRGEQESSSFGCSVSTGDVNGDGFDDLVVGALWYGNVQVAEGRAELFLGSAAGLEDAASWQEEGDEETAFLGASVAGAGDVNGDGFDDVLVGVPWLDAGGTSRGAAWLYEGSAAGLGAAPDWTAEADSDWSDFGRSVAGAGDANGDGFDDILVGAPTHTGGEDFEGAAYLYLGGAGGVEADAEWSTEGSVASGGLGGLVASAGDVNADGTDEFVVTDQGEVHLYAPFCSGEGTPCAGGLCHDGVCDPASCFIDGVWYDDGDVDPENECQACRVDDARLAFTPDADGTECADGLCRAGTCRASCLIGGVWVNEGVADARNECQSCQPTVDPFDWTDDAAGTACVGGLCRLGSCDATRCFIGGAWYGDWAANPANDCERCRVGTSRVAWTDLADGTDCGAGICRAGACDGDVCLVGGVFYDRGVPDPADECERCEPDWNRFWWTLADDGDACEGGLCHAGTCDALSCYVDFAWVPSHSSNPAAECEACDLSTSRTAWTDRPEGWACTDGICHEGTCEKAMCWVDDLWWDEGQTAPRSCRECVTAMDRVGWTEQADGKECDDGFEWTDGDACSAGDCVGTEVGGCLEPVRIESLPFVDETRATTDRPNDTSSYGPECTGVHGGGPDVAYLLEVEGGEDYRVTVHPAADFDVEVVLSATCDASVSCLDSSAKAGPGQSEEIAYHAEEDGKVFVLVDGSAALVSGAYRLEVRHVERQVPGCACRTSGAGSSAGALLPLAAAVVCIRRRRRG